MASVTAVITRWELMYKAGVDVVVYNIFACHMIYDSIHILISYNNNNKKKYA